MSAILLHMLLVIHLHGKTTFYICQANVPANKFSYVTYVTSMKISSHIRRKKFVQAAFKFVNTFLKCLN